MPRKSKNCEAKAWEGLPSKATSRVPTSRKPKAPKGRRLSADKANGLVLDGATYSLADGRDRRAAKASDSVPPASETELSAKDRSRPTDKAFSHVSEADTPKANGRGHNAGDVQVHHAPPVADTVALIRAEHRRRIYWMKQRLRIMGALGAEIRLALGWSRSLSKPEREKIEKQALDLIKRDGAGTDWETLITMTKTATAPFVDREKDHAKECERLAETLPAWTSFGEGVRGFGAASLGVIVGEAGDLAGYSNPGKLWKRMGLAVFDGKRQGGLPKNASAEQWIEHGYNRQRRSRMWNIGDALIKGNRDGEYRTLYLARKQYEIDREPGIKPIKAHRRAQRYMEKRLLRNLWSAWRRAGGWLSPTAAMPDASLSADAAERQAYEVATPKRPVPAAPLPARKAGRSANARVSPTACVPSAELSGGVDA